MSSTTAPAAVCKMTEAMPAATVPETVSAQAPKMPSLGVRKHPHVEGVYIYDPKHASYMLTRDEANSLGFWEFSEEDWDMIFLAEPKVSVAMLCNEMTDQRYRYGGLERAQRSQLKVEKDEFDCWNCNEFSSTLALTRSEANALDARPEFSEEEWAWIFCCEPESAVEVRTICDVLTPSHCKEAKRRYEQLSKSVTDRLEKIAAAEADGADVPLSALFSDAPIPSPPPTIALTRQQAVIQDVPLLTPAMLKAEAWGEPEPPSSEAQAWIKDAAQRLRSIPSSSGSIHAFLSRVNFIGELLQFFLQSPQFVEVLASHKSGAKLAKACLKAASNLTADERKVEQVRADLKYYRCPFYMRRKLDAGYKRVQDLVAIMRATVSPYINKND